MRTFPSKLLIAFALGIGFFSWQSCKERTTVSTGLIPPVDNINTFQLSPDSLNISLKVGVFDSVRTNQFLLNTSPLIGLGEIQGDPFFGGFTAGLYTQFVPPVANFSFPDLTKYTFDSVLLCLPYAGFSYGDTSNASSNFMSYKVYRVTEPLTFDDSSDYTFTDYNYDPTIIGSGTVSFKAMKDSFVVGSDTESNQLRIKLNKNYIYSQIVNIDTSNFLDGPTFLNDFMGWYIMPYNAGGSQQNRVSYFSMVGADAEHSARIDFYFHDNATNSVSVYSFPFQPAISAYINRMQRNYAGSPANNFVQVNIKRDSVVLQGFPGTYTDITIRNLNKIPPCVINQAELVLTAIPVGQDLNFPVPPHLLLEKVTSSGIEPIADVFGGSGSPSAGGLSFMDGNPKVVTINGQQYTQYNLNFPRELQKAILAGEDSLTFRISASSIYDGAFRMVAPGFNTSSDAAMKLNIIYTKIK